MPLTFLSLLANPLYGDPWTPPPLPPPAQLADGLGCSPISSPAWAAHGMLNMHLMYYLSLTHMGSCLVGVLGVRGASVFWAIFHAWGM